MFALVHDVASYPRYLPFCSDTRIRSQTPDLQVATITLAKGKIKFAFTTANTLRNDRSIDMKLVEGPFKHLRGIWRFTPNPHGGSDVSFAVDFEFANALLSMAFGAFFKGLVESMVGAFCDQAALRYGPPRDPTRTPNTETGLVS
jgi:ribosome-associated toxin RatA of RatAB toxin-antitoxin module